MPLILIGYKILCAQPGDFLPKEYRNEEIWLELVSSPLAVRLTLLEVFIISSFGTWSTFILLLHTKP